jgi:hypothetical protein
MSLQQPSVSQIVESLDLDQTESEQAALKRHAAVLEAAESTGRFRQAPVSLLCPGCGTVLDRRHHGLPERLAQSRHACETCETTLHRWSIVTIHEVFETAPGADQLQALTTDYWDERLWAGITTGDGNPRTDEYTQAYLGQADQFGWDWTVRCPLCRRGVETWTQSRPDYHHWRHDPDQGICLCRPCHEALSGGECDGDQDWVAQQLGLKNKYDLQLTRLALREQAVASHETFPELVSVLCGRYNLVHSEAEVETLLTQTLQTADVLKVVDDEYLFDCLTIHG